MRLGLRFTGGTIVKRTLDASMLSLGQRMMAIEEVLEVVEIL